MCFGFSKVYLGLMLQRFAVNDEAKEFSTRAQDFQDLRIMN
jgi:hypothetical protein